MLPIESIAYFIASHKSIVRKGSGNDAEGVLKISFDHRRRYCNFGRLEDWKDKVKKLIGRCLWHIQYQTKCVLWQEGAKHMGSEWLRVMPELIKICEIRPLVDC